MTSTPTNLSEAAVPGEVLDVLRTLHGRRFKAYLVGGCVRDMLRGREPKDFDIATSARPEEVQGAFRKVIPTGIEHGTVTVLVKGRHVEVTTFRVESEYRDGRRPSRVEFHSEIAADLSRRDFTINAMAYNPVDGELVDPFGGRLDLTAGVIRCVGGPHARFSEDGLRPLRAVRFAAMLGFTVDPLTRSAISDTLDVFRKVAQERIREELSKLLTAPSPELGLALLRTTGLLEHTSPELWRCDDWQWSTAVDTTCRARNALEPRLAAIFAFVPVARARERLRVLTFPNGVVEKVAALLPHLDPSALPAGDDATLRRHLARVGREHIADVLSLIEARLEAQRLDKDGFIPLRARYEAVLATNPPLTSKELALKGDAIMKILAVRPSPIVGEATRFLVDQVLADPAANTPEALEQLLRKWASEKQS